MTSRFATILYLLTLSLFTISLGYPQTNDYIKNQVIEDPSISERCKEMLKDRQKKISIKQRLKTLKKRTSKAIKISENSKRKLFTSGQLEATQTKINQEQKLIDLKIKIIEEKIVRRGCPGIML